MWCPNLWECWPCCVALATLNGCVLRLVSLPPAQGWRDGIAVTKRLRTQEGKALKAVLHGGYKGQMLRHRDPQGWFPVSKVVEDLQSTITDCCAGKIRHMAVDPEDGVYRFEWFEEPGWHAGSSRGAGDGFIRLSPKVPEALNADDDNPEHVEEALTNLERSEGLQKLQEPPFQNPNAVFAAYGGADFPPQAPGESPQADLPPLSLPACSAAQETRGGKGMSRSPGPASAKSRRHSEPPRRRSKDSGRKRRSSSKDTRRKRSRSADKHKRRERSTRGRSRDTSPRDKTQNKKRKGASSRASRSEQESANRSSKPATAGAEKPKSPASEPEGHKKHEEAGESPAARVLEGTASGSQPKTASRPKKHKKKEDPSIEDCTSSSGSSDSSSKSVYNKPKRAKKHHGKKASRK